MKLQSVKFSLRIFDRGERRILGARGGAKPVGQGGHFVAMTVPDIDLLAEPVEQLRAVRHLQACPAPYSRRPLNRTWPPR